jgi:hypothetical protein
MPIAITSTICVAGLTIKLIASLVPISVPPFPKKVEISAAHPALKADLIGIEKGTQND